MNFKHAIITQTKPGWARVKFPELDVDVDQDPMGVESAWLQVLQQWTLGDRTFCMPVVGEQVVCLMDENLEAGVILGGVYSDADPVPDCAATARFFDFPDGTTIQYDPEAHKLIADIQGAVELTATGDVKADVDGNVTITSAGTIKLKAQAINLEAPSISVKGDGLVTGNWYVTGNNSAHHVHTVVGSVALRGEP